MRLDINLASQPYEDARQFWRGWGTGLAFLGLLTLVLIYYATANWLIARQDRREIADYRAQIAERDRERVEAEAFLSRPENRTTRDKSQFLNALIQRKAFSWTKVFEELERVMPPRLHVVSIHPEMNSDDQLEIKMVVAGESRERALDLVKRMEGSQHFQGTQITQERQGAQTPTDVVQFDITALYVPEMPSRSTP
jgi:type IV pilus assembly protein PilN